MENITLNGRVFELRDPSTSTVLSILNVIGRVGMKAEGLASAMVGNPSSRAAVFGLLAAMTMEDLQHFAIAVLQVDPSDKATVKWLEKNELKVAPLIDAFFVNLKLSTDLVDSLKSFFAGAGLIEKLVQALRPPVVAPESPTGSG